MTCRSGCRSKDHATYGECLRSANFEIDRHALAGHGPAERDKDRRLSAYESARGHGLQPKTTAWTDIRRANEHGGVAPTPVTAD